MIYPVVSRLIRHSAGLAGAFLAAGAFGQSDYATPYAFATMAGTPGIVGAADGAGRAAQFSSPNKVAVDGSNNIYIADSGNNTIRKITSSGVVTTLAGTPGHPGSADGTGGAARFQNPMGVAVDRAGNVYVADSGNNTIRKISSDGVVTTLAGAAGQFGSADGDGGNARFSSPSDVAVDTQGNVYVADLDNRTIRRVTPSGIVTTLAGSAGSDGSADGAGANAQFASPEGVAVDGAGNVYVADWSNELIRKITPTVLGGFTSWVVTTLAGTPGASFGSADGTSGAAQFFSPSGVAVDSAGNVYVADTNNNTVRKITPFGIVTTLAGMAGVDPGIAGGTGSAARFDEPNGVAVDGAGNVYVADTGSQTIREITPSAVVSTLAGIAGDPGSSDGVGSGAYFDGPTGVAVDSAGDFYVADTLNDAIRKISLDGAVTTLAGAAGQSGSADGTGSAARFNQPRNVAVDAAGNIYVADTVNELIRKVTPAGAVTTLAGIAGQAGYADGAGSAAEFFSPSGVALDNAGNVYVADTGNNMIREISSDGAVATLAGNGGAGYADGIGAAAQFDGPAGVAVDNSGNVYVADSINDAIRKITSSGTVTTLAGSALSLRTGAGFGGFQPISPSFGTATDGVGTAAEFYRPTGVAVDGSGNVYVADTTNDLVRKVTPAGVVTTLAGMLNTQNIIITNFGAIIVPPSNGTGIDGTGEAALFYYPSGVAVDGSGNLYVADTANGTIRKGRQAVGPTAPTITMQPESQSLNSGSTVVFTGGVANATGYQWFFNGNPLNNTIAGTTDVVSGATGPQLVITDATSASGGIYTLLAANSTGSTAESGPASLSMETVPDPGLAMSLSTRAFVGTGDSILINGFYVVGSTSRTFLVQALGPALQDFGVTGFLQHPALSIHQIQNGQDATLYSNTGWGSSQTLSAAAASVFASPALQSGSDDSELLVTLPPGGYSAEVSGADGGTGIALCAVYELP